MSYMSEGVSNKEKVMKTTVYGEDGVILGEIDANETGALERLYRAVYGTGQVPSINYYYMVGSKWICETLGSGCAAGQVSDVPARIRRAK
jgi:hypothetical protein